MWNHKNNHPKQDAVIPARPPKSAARFVQTDSAGFVANFNRESRSPTHFRRGTSSSSRKVLRALSASAKAFGDDRGLRPQDDIKIVRLTKLSEIHQIKSEWEDLLRRARNKSIFLTWEWLITWWETYGENNELWWINVKDENGKLIGSAPFYLRKQSNGLILPHRELRFIGTGAPVSPEHLDVLAVPEKSAEVIEAIQRYLVDHAKDWDVLLLTDLTRKGGATPPESTGRGDCAPTALKLNDALIEDQLPSAPYIPLPDIWENYFKSLGKWLRRTVVRQRNKQTRELNMSFYVWSPKDGGLDVAFGKFEKLYALRKESVKVENKFEESPGYQKFHRLLASRFAERGWLNLAFLKIGDKEVACEYTFKYLDTLYSYQCGFDPAFGKNNVFKVLRSYVIEDAVRQGMKEFDLLRGEEPYKYDWKALPRKKQMLRCFSPTFYGGMLNQILRLRRKGKQWFHKVGAPLVGARLNEKGGQVQDLPLHFDDQRNNHE